MRPDRDVIVAWQAATAERNAIAAAACLAPQVVVVPSNIGWYRFEGRASMRLMLTAAFGFIDDLHYTNMISNIGGWTLRYQVHIAGRPLTATQQLRTAPDGLIREIALPGSSPMEFVYAMERVGARLVAPPFPRPRRRRGKGIPRKSSIGRGVGRSA
ncbi:hypothetical protein [Frankia sp. R82]|uniref:hypothetical protein n=1 Tax=Frankia sp. R82 TaxID=2950553 RepID=UPI0020434C67|nr:hypothetical protein [Frankia sp. R82]MCM3882551.1 hypothetical protein [Frankia sp. R82]